MRPAREVATGIIGALERIDPTRSGLRARPTRTPSASTGVRRYADRPRWRSPHPARADLAADVALQVGTRWLDLRQARLSVPVARFAVVQADENIKVVPDRYRPQLSTCTEVLGAETRRVQSLNRFYNALYDESLALFRLRRAVGDL